MLSFSESDPEFAVDAALVEKLQAEISDEDYQANIAGLLERSWKRDVLRRRLSTEAKWNLSYQHVFDHTGATFICGDALAAYWEQCLDVRNIAIQPSMLSLYHYILIGKSAPT
jgi:N-acetylglutamate synthase-like GNAT family acetyltransferase